jgi:hypothetical protein
MNDWCWIEKQILNMQIQCKPEKQRRAMIKQSNFFEYIAANSN